MDVFIQVAQTFGISAACLVALSYAVWKSLKWLGVAVIKPVADRHLKFLDDMTANIDAIVKQNGELTRNQEKMVETQNSIADKLGAIVGDLRDIEKSMQAESSKHADTFGGIVSDLKGIQEGLNQVKGMVVHSDKVVIVPKVENGG